MKVSKNFDNATTSSLSFKNTGSIFHVGIFIIFKIAQWRNTRMTLKKNRDKYSNPLDQSERSPKAIPKIRIYNQQNYTLRLERCKFFAYSP